MQPYAAFNAGAVLHDRARKNLISTWVASSHASSRSISAADCGMAASSSAILRLWKTRNALPSLRLSSSAWLTLRDIASAKSSSISCFWARAEVMRCRSSTRLSVVNCSIEALPISCMSLVCQSVGDAAGAVGTAKLAVESALAQVDPDFWKMLKRLVEPSSHIQVLAWTNVLVSKLQGQGIRSAAAAMNGASIAQSGRTMPRLMALTGPDRQCEVGKRKPAH